MPFCSSALCTLMLNRRNREVLLTVIHIASYDTALCTILFYRTTSAGVFNVTLIIIGTSNCCLSDPAISYWLIQNQCFLGIFAQINEYRIYRVYAFVHVASWLPSLRVWRGFVIHERVEIHRLIVKPSSGSSVACVFPGFPFFITSLSHSLSPSLLVFRTAQAAARFRRAWNVSSIAKSSYAKQSCVDVIRAFHSLFWFWLLWTQPI